MTKKRKTTLKKHFWEEKRPSKGPPPRRPPKTRFSAILDPPKRLKTGHVEVKDAQSTSNGRVLRGLEKFFEPLKKRPKFELATTEWTEFWKGLPNAETDRWGGVRGGERL